MAESGSTTTRPLFPCGIDTWAGADPTPSSISGIAHMRVALTIGMLRLMLAAQTGAAQDCLDSADLLTPLVGRSRSVASQRFIFRRCRKRTNDALRDLPPDIAGQAAPPEYQKGSSHLLLLLV